MASIIYKFATSPDAAGRTVTVKDARTHATVTSGSFSNSADETGVVTYRPTLEEGDYYGEFTVPGVPGLEGEKHPVRTRRVDGVLDVPGSIAAGGGGTPTEDTAFLIVDSATLPSDNTLVTVSVAWDDRFPQVDWLDITDGAATVPDGALDCVVGIIGTFSYDFTSTTPPDDPGFLSAYAQETTSSTVTVNEAVTANGQDFQDATDAEAGTSAARVNFAPGDALVVQVAAGAWSDGSGEVPVDDATVTATVAVAITRGGSAPTLPS